MKTTQQFALTFVVLSLLGSRASAAISSTDEIFTRITTGASSLTAESQVPHRLRITTATAGPISTLEMAAAVRTPPIFFTATTAMALSTGPTLSGSRLILGKTSGLPGAITTTTDSRTWSSPIFPIRKTFNIETMATAHSRKSPKAPLSRTRASLSDVFGAITTGMDGLTFL